MTTVYLSLGSNLGDRRGYLERALESLRDEFREVRASRIYETEPVDLLDQPWFLNMVAEFKTEWRPEFLLEWVQRLERDLGRQREVPKGPRTLDADILLFGSETRNGSDLVLPHPAMLGRRHVLRPLAELAPDLLLPGTGWTVQEALEKTKDISQVKLYAQS